MMMKYLIIMMIFLSTMITINSSSWFNAWIGMEINLLSFIPMMLNKMKKMKISNSMMIYFIVQASASSIMMIMIIMIKVNLFMMKINSIMMIIQMSLLMKLGASPFHWWMPKVVMNLSWMNCFILLTWQKIAPLCLLMISNTSSIIYLSSLMTIYMSTILGLNQTSIKMIITYSSLNHLSWMFMIMMTNMNIMMNYYMFYMMTMLLTCMFLNNRNLNYLNQLYSYNHNNLLYSNILFMLLFLSLSGLPPMLGFFPKMLILLSMMKNKLIIESVYFIIVSTISLSYYMNILTAMFILTKNLPYWIHTFYNNKYLSKSLTSILLMNCLLISIMIISLNKFFMI